MRSLLLFLVTSSAIAATEAKPARFFARRDYAGGAQLVRVADVNGDKIPDLVEISPGSPVVMTLLGNGNGTFHTGPKSQVGFQGLKPRLRLDIHGNRGTMVMPEKARMR